MHSLHEICTRQKPDNAKKMPAANSRRKSFKISCSADAGEILLVERFSCRHHIKLVVILKSVLSVIAERKLAVCAVCVVVDILDHLLDVLCI